MMLLLIGSAAAQNDQAALTIPAFCGYAHPDPGAMRRDRDTGSVHRCDGELRYYVDIAATGSLEVAAQFAAAAPAQMLSLQLSRIGADGSATASSRIPKHTAQDAQRATFTGYVLDKPGTYMLTLRRTDQGPSNQKSPLEHLLALELRGDAARGARASTVERRNAASVHLWYDVPAEHRDDVAWFYCELTPTTDPLWTYYMATGWHRGYFGMQVNSETERRIIFSVWDAGNEAVDRKKVDAKDLVQLIAKGDDVYAGGFGNEGTGGHSHLKYAWKDDDTVRFLMRAEPDQDTETTTYTGWFSVRAKGSATATDWRLVASFQAPEDGRFLHGLYSFSENFSGANGDRLRRCRYGNVWIKPRNGAWIAMTTARFTHDGHGNQHRLDRGAEVEHDRFVLVHGDFVTRPTRRNTALTIARQPGEPPAQLPAR